MRWMACCLSVMSCSTAPESAPPHPEAPVRLVGLPPVQHCDAAQLLERTSGALSIPPDGSVSRLQVRAWLASAHCDHMSQPTHPLHTVRAHQLSSGALALAAHQAQRGDPAGAADTLCEAWAASQDLGRVAPYSLPIAVDLEQAILSELQQLAAQLAPTEAAALSRDVAWLVARRPSWSAAQHHRQLAHTATPDPVEDLQRAWVVHTLTDEPERLDAALAARDLQQVATVEAGAERWPAWDPRRAYLHALAARARQALTAREDLDSRVRALLAALDRPQPPAGASPATAPIPGPHGAPELGEGL